MKLPTKRLVVRDFEAAWKERVSGFVRGKIVKARLLYRELDISERDAVLLRITDFLISRYVVYAGKHRHGQWEAGWGENLSEFKKTKKISGVVPRYFGKYPINRFRQTLIMARTKSFEADMLSILEYWLFDKYLRNIPAVYEFGCGTGHNLLRVREVNKTAELWGLDWVAASQELIHGLAQKLHDVHLRGHRFDFFNPDKAFHLDPNGAVYTVAALEQTGSNYKKFVAYLLKNKPFICVHIEPIGELLDKDVLLDNLSIKYFEKRNYLSGYLNYLRALEKEGKVKIHEARRSFIGSMFIDGYSVIVWSPVK